MTVDSLTQQRDDATGTEPVGNGELAGGPTEAPADQQPEANEPSAEDQAKTKRGRPKGTSAKKTRTVELTLTVTGTADGEWQAELKHGSKWVARGLDIPAAAVSRAAKELHVDLSGPIDDVINAAREQQQAKVAQLEAELQQAKQALAELES
ncbi:DUF6319 family protein [Amycolatopsis palatopharyngis]|uniref:DUF6319 family protein n=1 Tax=Amycolatopsis palatopharyngis TaxID=187982 RepID=UPI000E23FA48|nr:DUF6319 family protein [Amycolatopsis palatopharyngis]